MTPLEVALLALACLLPCLPMRLVSNESIARARDYFVLGMLMLGTVAALFYALPFAPVGLWLLWWWRSNRELPAVITWVAMGALWVGVQHLPPVAWRVIPWAWLAVGAGAGGVLAYQWWQLRDKAHPWRVYRVFHQAAWFGQRSVAACLFALLLPFAPWWALPIPLLGLWLTSSWVAILAALIAATMRWG